MCACACVYPCVCVRMYVRMCTRVSSYVGACVYACECMCMYPCVLVYESRPAQSSQEGTAQCPEPSPYVAYSVASSFPLGLLRL
jgi:hypothetical protein